MQKIAILGCGWLGFPLGTKLVENQFEVSGSTTSIGKLNLFEKASIKPFLIRVSENEIHGNIQEFLQGASILVIDIPPKLRAFNSENFVQKIQNLIPFVEQSQIKKVLFVSSTSVFADDNTIVNQSTEPSPDSESGRQLWETEKLLQHNNQFKTTIVRFGGLVGSDRHPAKMLAGKTNVQNPDAKINLIHQQDCISIIENIVINNVWNKTFNAVAPYHPTRIDYYTKKAIDFGLPIPEFDHSKVSLGKTVLSDNLIHDLGFQFDVVKEI